jgi:hypothetical protein
MTDWLRVTIETGRECGLSTVSEAIDNMALHYPFSSTNEFVDWMHAVQDNDTIDTAESLDAIFYFDGK